MPTIAAWTLTLAVAVCVTVLAASGAHQALHSATVATVAVAITGMAIRTHRQLARDGASAHAIAGATARHLGLVWAWGGLTLAATYLLIVDKRWPEWWQFVLGFVFAAAASIACSRMLDADGATKPGDDILVKFGRAVLVLQLIGMAAAILSLFVDDKFPRSTAHADWAGCNIFFFGALAVAAISADALRNPSRASSDD